jgi:hypothetical protein
MRLQDVLKEREAEITLLEESLKMSEQRDSPIKTTPNGVNGDHNPNGNGLAAVLSPRTLDQFDHIRKNMENGHIDNVYSESSSVQSEDDSLERLNELML